MKPLRITDYPLRLRVRSGRLLPCRDGQRAPEWEFGGFPDGTVVGDPIGGFVTLPALRWLANRGVVMVLENLDARPILTALSDYPINEWDGILQLKAYLDPRKRLEIANEVLRAATGKDPPGDLSDLGQLRMWEAGVAAPYWSSAGVVRDYPSARDPVNASWGLPFHRRQVQTYFIHGRLPTEVRWMGVRTHLPGAAPLALAIVFLFLLSVGGLVHAVPTHPTSGVGPASIVAGHPSVAPHPSSGQINQVIANIPIPGTNDGPSAGAVFDPTSGDIWLPSNGTNLTVISGASNSVTHEFKLGPYSAAVTPTYVPSVDRIYDPQASGNPPPSKVNVIDAATYAFVANVSTGLSTYPAPATYDPANQDLYVSDYGLTTTPGQSNVTVISTVTDSVVATVIVGEGPFTSVYDPADGDIYVPNTITNNVSIISGTTNKVIATIPGLDLLPTFYGDENMITNAPVYDPVSQEVYVPDTGASNLTVLKGTTLVKNITVGPGPGTPAVDLANGDLYVPLDGPGAANNGNTTSVISPTSNTLIKNIGVGVYPAPPTYDPVNGEVYVSNQGDLTVSAINTTTNTVVATDNIVGPFGSWPIQGVFDSTNNELYVPDYLGTNVTVIAAGAGPTAPPPGTYTVTFTESGLPSGAWWSVTFNGSGQNQTTTTSLFSGYLNGTYTWTLDQPWDDQNTCPSTLLSYTNSLRIQGSSVNVPLAFACPGSGGTASSSGFLGLPGNDGYLLLGGLAAAIVVAAVVVVKFRPRAPMGGSPSTPPPPPGPWTPPPPPPPP